MRCLTLTQPWATLVAVGAKKIETRGWKTAYRGPLAIHASSRFPASSRALCREQPFHDALRACGYRHPSELPTAVLLGLVELEECVAAQEVLAILPRNHPERAFGDFRGRRWVFRLRNAMPLAAPTRRSLAAGSRRANLMPPAPSAPAPARAAAPGAW